MLKPYNDRIVFLKVKTDYILNNPYWIPNNFHILLILLLISSKNQKQWKEKCYSPLYHVIQPLKFIFLSYALVFLHKLAPTSTHLLKVTAYKNHPLSWCHQFSSLKSFSSDYIQVLIPHILRYFPCTPCVCFYGKIPLKCYIHLFSPLSYFLFLLSPINFKRNQNFITEYF